MRIIYIVLKVYIYKYKYMNMEDSIVTNDDKMKNLLFAYSDTLKVMFILSNLSRT